MAHRIICPKCTTELLVYPEADDMVYQEETCDKCGSFIYYGVEIELNIVEVILAKPGKE